MYIHAHVLHTFAYVSVASAASPAHTQPSMKEAALRAAATKDGCVGAGEAADAAETYANVCKT